MYKKYGGAGKKKTLILNDKQYLVKFQNPVRKKGKKLQISYVNSVYSEYIGSKIFKLFGMETQEVILGTYNSKIVCACEDFTSEKSKLIEFEEYIKAVLLDELLTTNISDIYDKLERIFINKEKIENIKINFWKMFIIDFIIGNTDRHNNNWGFVVNANEKGNIFNTKTNQIEFAPIFDCGSSLTPTLTDEEMAAILKSKSEFSNYVKNAYSAIMVDNKKLHSYEYIKSKKIEYCNKYLQEILERFELESIHNLIEEMPISDVRKEFYIKIIDERVKLLEAASAKIEKDYISIDGEFYPVRKLNSETIDALEEAEYIKNNITSMKKYSSDELKRALMEE
jgi:hypothetical protein